MKSSTKTALFTLFSLLLAILLIWLSMRTIDFSKSLETLKDANYMYIILSVSMGGLAYWFRSQRWRLLLRPMGYEISSTNAFFAVCINYLMNLGIPRSGEFARSGALYKSDLVPVNKSFGTVVSERLVDMVCLAVVSAFTILINFNIVLNLVNQALAGRQPKSIDGYFLSLGILFALISLLLLLFYYFRHNLLKTRLFRRIRLFVYGLRKGLRTIFQLKERRLFFLYTLGIWVLYYLMTYIVVFALPDAPNLGWEIGFFLLIAGGVGMVIPASGGVGSFHKAMQLAFLTLGLTEQLGFDYALLMHTPQTLLAIVLGTVSILFQPNRLG